VIFLHQFFNQSGRWQVVQYPGLAHEMQGLTAEFIIQYEFGQAECQNKIQHTGTSHGIHTRKRSQKGAAESLTARLRIEDFGVAQGHVGL